MLKFFHKTNRVKVYEEIFIRLIGLRLVLKFFHKIDRVGDNFYEHRSLKLSHIGLGRSRVEPPDLVCQ